MPSLFHRSFGVVMIEVFTDGGKPYDGLMNAAVINQVQAGHRAEQPELCPDKIYSILLRCWSATQSDRPTFAELAVILQAAAPHGQTSGFGFDDSDDDSFGGGGSGNEYETAVAHNPAHDSANEALYLGNAPAPPVRTRSLNHSSASNDGQRGYANPMPHRSNGARAPANSTASGDDEYLQAIAAVGSASSEYLTVASTQSFGVDAVGGSSGSESSDYEV